MSGVDSAGKPADEAGIIVTWRESPVAAKALLAGIFVNRLGTFLQVFLVLFLTARGFSTTDAGFALGIYATGSVFGVLVGGVLSDRLGPRRTILVSMVGTAALVLAILYAHNYLLLLVVLGVAGAVGGAYRPALASLLSELTPKHRQVMIFAMYRLALNLGTTAGPLIGAALWAISDDWLFWGQAAAALAYAVIAAIALPRRADRPTESSTESFTENTAESTAAAPATAAPVISKPMTTEVDESVPKGTDAGAGSGYRAVLADRRYALFLIALLINAVVYVQYLSTLPVAMRAAGLSTTWFSVMVALNGFIVITCELLVTKVVQRWPMRIVVLVGFVLLGGGLASYALPLGVAAFVLGTLIWSLAEVVAGPTMFAYPAVASPKRLRGRYLGAASAMFSIGGAIGPVAGLALWEQVGASVWWWCGGAALLGILAAWYGMHSAETSPIEMSPAEAPTEMSPVEPSPTAVRPSADDRPGADPSAAALIGAPAETHDSTSSTPTPSTEAPERTALT